MQVAPLTLAPPPPQFFLGRKKLIYMYLIILACMVMIRSWICVVDSLGIPGRIGFHAYNSQLHNITSKSIDHAPLNIQVQIITTETTGNLSETTSLG